MDCLGRSLFNRDASSLLLVLNLFVGNDPAWLDNPTITLPAEQFRSTRSFFSQIANPSPRVKCNNSQGVLEELNKIWAWNPCETHGGRIHFFSELTENPWNRYIFLGPSRKTPDNRYIFKRTWGTHIFFSEAREFTIFSIRGIQLSTNWSTKTNPLSNVINHFGERKLIWQGSP